MKDILNSGACFLILADYSSVALEEVAGSTPYPGDTRVAAAQVVSPVVHPVLLGRGAVLPQETLPGFGAPAALEGRRCLETLAAAGALGLAFVEQC